MSLVDDPLQGGIADFGRRLRAGETSAVAATEAYLAASRHWIPRCAPTSTWPRNWRAGRQQRSMLCSAPVPISGP